MTLNTDFKNKVKQLVHESVIFSKNALAKNYPEFINIPIVEKIGYGNTRKCHRGGKYLKGYGINMAGYLFFTAQNYYTPGNVIRFNEYSSYKDDKVIGSVYTTSLSQLILLSTGHEVAHACQRFVDKFRGLGRTPPHGELFMTIYKDIRLEANKLLPNQQELKIEFNKLIEEIKKRELYV